MDNVFQWLIDNKVAQNGFSASAIYNGLHLGVLNDDGTIKSRALLYRAWRPKTDKKNEVPSWQAFELAIAGIDPSDVEPRQIDMFITPVLYCPRCEGEVTTTDNQIWDCDVCETVLFYSELDKYKGETHGVPFSDPTPVTAAEEADRREAGGL